LLEFADFWYGDLLPGLPLFLIMAVVGPQQRRRNSFFSDVFGGHTAAMIKNRAGSGNKSTYQKSANSRRKKMWPVTQLQNFHVSHLHQM